jgi:adenylate kinase
MINLVLFGPPGAGKGTQSAKIIEKYGLIHLSTGDLLRAEIAASTQLGLEAKKLMDQGILVPDAVVIGMIENKINENKSAAGFIFDGFPRTVAQAAKFGLEISNMIALEVNEEVLTNRLLERGKTSGRPDDQNEELIRKRVQEYTDKTAPVANYYLAQQKFSGINGIGDIDVIFNEIVSILES